MAASAQMSEATGTQPQACHAAKAISLRAPRCVNHASGLHQASREHLQVLCRVCLSAHAKLPCQTRQPALPSASAGWLEAALSAFHAHCIAGAHGVSAQQPLCWLMMLARFDGLLEAKHCQRSGHLGGRSRRRRQRPCACLVPAAERHLAGQAHQAGAPVRCRPVGAHWCCAGGARWVRESVIEAVCMHAKGETNEVLCTCGHQIQTCCCLLGSCRLVSMRPRPCRLQQLADRRSCLGCRGGLQPDSLGTRGPGGGWLACRQGRLHSCACCCAGACRSKRIASTVSPPLPVPDALACMQSSLWWHAMGYRDKGPPLHD